MVYTPLPIINSFSFIPFHVFRKNNYLPSQILSSGRKTENGSTTIFNSTIQDLLKNSRIVQLVKKFPVRFEVLTGSL